MEKKTRFFTHNESRDISKGHMSSKQHSIQGLICESVKADGLLKKTAGSSCVESSKLLNIMSQRKECLTRKTLLLFSL